MQVRAKSNFEHYGARKRGNVFSVSSHIAESLSKKGLVEIVEENDEQKLPLSLTVGEDQESSASPAVQASQEQTSEELNTGDLPVRSPWGKRAKRKRGK